VDKPKQLAHRLHKRNCCYRRTGHIVCYINRTTSEALNTAVGFQASGAE
jgi:hypothetical protein